MIENKRSYTNKLNKITLTSPSKAKLRYSGNPEIVTVDVAYFQSPELKIA